VDASFERDLDLKVEVQPQLECVASSALILLLHLLVLLLLHHLLLLLLLHQHLLVWLLLLLLHHLIALIAAAAAGRWRPLYFFLSAVAKVELAVLGVVALHLGRGWLSTPTTRRSSGAGGHLVGCVVDWIGLRKVWTVGNPLRL
jgi:hypothetical protein